MSAPSSVLPQRVVVRLLVALTAGAGCVDVFCVTRLGGSFASVVTGNLVQLGHAVATQDGRLAWGVGAAIGSYALGVAAATLVLRGDHPGWSGRTTLAASLELALLLGMTAGWLATDGQPGRGTSSLLLGLGAAAMGAQSVVTLGSGVRGASTTYLTGTLTSLVQALVRGPSRAAAAGGAIRLAALLAGAVGGALLLRVAPVWAPALALAAVSAVVMTALLAARHVTRES